LEAFSYSVSHDLRAPLRAIASYASILAANYKAVLDPDAQQMLDTILASSKHLSQLIDALLNFSRLSRRALTKVNINLNNLLRELLKSFAPEIASRQIDWSVGDLPPVYGDLILIQQVFANLIGNAIKYTRLRAPARIEIECLRDEKQPVYFIRDNGAGFDMRHANKLFGVFQRLHTDTEFEGTGIGLATVQRIIQRHGGRIWAEAEPDKGATFYFTLA
jgi:light-regulated signal transduction histidine kinase (bacteriophytochrome)